MFASLGCRITELTNCQIIKSVHTYVFDDMLDENNF